MFRQYLARNLGTEVTSDGLEPIRLLDDTGRADDSVRGFVRNLVACDYSPATCRSYVLSLLRWRRFLVAVDIGWDRAERRDVRDFVLWMKGADNPQRHHSRSGAPTPGTVNTVTGKRTLSPGYAPATINHALSAVRMYYDYRAGTDLVLVAELLGHRRLDTTRRYSLPTAADRQRVIDQLPDDR